MRTALALVVVMLAACGEDGGGGDDGGGEGDACGALQPCGSGLACSVTHTDDNKVGECFAASGDIDGDGLTNDKDYCNAMPGGEYDEDRDLIGDICDRCPIAEPPDTADPDNDEVDSPCDPDPREPGDKIVVFEGFRNGIPNAWKKTGAWEQRGGDVVVTPDSSTAIAQLTTALPLVANNMAILVQYRIDAVDTAAARNYVGLVGRDERPASVEEVRCGGQRSGGDSLYIETKASAMGEAIIDAFDSSSLYSVSMRVQNLNAACAMIADNVMIAAQATTGGQSLSEAGLFVQGATARFQYLLVIQRSSAID